jgi:hypothetical protein
VVQRTKMRFLTQRWTSPFLRGTEGRLFARDGTHDPF